MHDRLEISTLRCLAGLLLMSAQAGPAQQAAYFVKDTFPGAIGGAQPEIATLANKAYFSSSEGGGRLWASDGTPAGTAIVSPVATAPLRLTATDTLLFFTGNQASTGRELWKSDGTEVGTSLVKDVWPGTAASIDNLVAVGSTLFFRASQGTPPGQFLWKSDGTNAGTVLVKSVMPDNGSPTAVGSRLFFTTYSQSGGHTYDELWVSDGTTAGTVLLLSSDRAYYSPEKKYTNLTAVGGTLFFGVSEVQQLWTSNGTVGGTGQVSTPGINFLGPMTSACGIAYFVAYPPTSGQGGVELYRSDGSSGGTYRVKDIYPGTTGEGIDNDSSPSGLRAVGCRVFLTAADGAHGREPWVSDGTGPGTLLLRDVRPGVAASGVTNGAAANGLFYFLADDGTSGPEPWVSDGTPAGTNLLRDIRVGTSGSAASAFAAATAPRTVFVATDGIRGAELWVAKPAGNSPPVAADDSYQAIADVPLQVPSPGVIGNDSDGEEGTLTVSQVTVPPAHAASFTSSANGSFVYTPVPGFTGADGFVYQVDDGQGAQATASVSIAVRARHAGIIVSPTSGLTTTEGGATATFSIVLDDPPTADVILTVSSSDTTEGTVAPAGLTFTPANWSTAQVVTVTGVNDILADGDIAYSVVTGTATSTDPAYSGLNPSDVTVTNVDNEIAVTAVDDVNDGVCSVAHCSLREAILKANALGGAQTIGFRLSGAGPWVIQPASALPAVTGSALIDGTTQPGFGSTPVVEIDGGVTAVGTDGLLLTGSAATVRALVIRGYRGSGGAGGTAIVLAGSGGHRVEGCYLGVGVTGATAAGNYVGVLVSSANNQIGGVGSAGNVIAASAYKQIQVEPGKLDNRIVGNTLGADATGTVALPGPYGVYDQGTRTQIGGVAPGEGNVVASAVGNGIGLTLVGSATVVEGNFVGVSRDGSAQLRNNWGILAAGTGRVGGSLAGQANQVAYSREAGIVVYAAVTRLSRNQIHHTSNGLAIDLSPSFTNGVTANDAGDADTGPNGYQNFPVLTAATTAGGVTTVAGTLNSKASRSYRLELFSNHACNASGHGEAQVFLGDLVAATDGSGTLSFSLPLTPPQQGGRFLSATAIDEVTGETSELSTCQVVTAVDTTPPTGPAIGSTVPSAGTWSADNTVSVQWSGAADEPGGSGVAGYSILWDHLAASTPDGSVEIVHGVDPHVTTSSPLADAGDWTFHLRACDVAGNCAAAVHAGPFRIDTVAPTVAGSLAATSHAVSVPSSDATIDVAWAAATDATAGVDGYSVSFDGAASSPCETTKDVEEATLAATSPTLAAGTWYAHVCAVDNAGNWGAVRHAGPFVVDPTAPPGDMVLYYTDYGLDVIRRIRVDGLGEVTLRSEPEPFGLALDPGLDHLYWMSRSPIALRRSATDGTGATGLVSTGMVAPYGVALDLAAGKVYWSDPSGGTVRRANLDGSGEASFLSGLSVPVGIAIDPIGRRLYVAEFGAGRISSAPLAGGATTLFRSSVPAVHDLAIDSSQRRLFWSESAVSGRIGRVDLDGSGAIDVKANEAFPGGLVVDSTHGYVYWVQEIGGTIRRARTDGSGLLTIRSGLTSPSGLVLDQGDVTPPTSPSVAALAPHVQGGWASASTIAMQWSGAGDEAGGSGLAGYSVLFDASPLTEPDITLEVAQGSDPHGVTSPPLADGPWYFHLRACDVAGNCAAAIHSGPYGVDTTAPTGLLVMSPSHPISGWSSDATVDVTISGAADANGLTGYSIVFDQSAATVPDAVTEQAGTTFTGTASPDGNAWYVHVRACDAAGNCGATVHAGPYWVDATAPSLPGTVTSSSHGSGTPVADATIDVAWGAATDLTSGLAGYRFAFDTTATTSGCLGLGGATGATTATSGALADGVWYVHVCAVDEAGNAGPVTHGGPYVVDTAQTGVALYWGSFSPSNLGRGLLGGTGSILLATPEVASPLGVDVDPAVGRVYWVEYFGNRLRRANLDGTGAVDLITGLGTPHDLELDLPGGKVYWSERGTGRVCRANLDGSVVETVVSVATPFNLALDRVAGEIYFTNPGAGKIQRVATNGSSLVDVLTDLPQVIGLAVDTIAGRIYWSEYRDLTGVVKSADLDGSNVQTIASALRYPSALVLDSAAGWIYWAEQFAQRIGRARLDGSVVETALDVPGNPEGLALLRADAAVPTEPTVVSTTHTVGGWGTAPVIGMQWSGASDAGSGLAGYSVQFGVAASTVPDRTVDVAHGSDPHSFASVVLADGLWYFHLRSCDLAGNCTSGVHRGPYGIDGIPPSPPGSLTSPSHTVGVASGDPTIEVTWTAATDATSGVNGYAVLFDGNPAATCDQEVDQNAAATGSTSNPLASGTWYAHVCAVDVAGNWGAVANAGPYTIDATAPTVTSVRPVAGSGSLAEGTLLDSGVTQLLMAFSEAMATSGGGSAAAVGNYRLFAAGPNHVIDSTSCGSPAVDDVAVTVGGATYLAASRTAALTVDHTTALAASAYRLFACGSLADAQSNALDGNADTTPGDDFGRSFTVQPTDLLANPNFDLDTSGWTLLGNPGELSWQSADADVAPTSGSAQLVTLVGAGQTHGIGQCVAVTAGEHYRARGLTRIASGTAGQPKVGIRIELFASAACTGSPSATVASPLASGDTAGGWRPLETTLLAPAGTLSARVRFHADNTAGGASFAVGFDDLIVNRYVELLFMNGFEGGNTGAWSGAVGGP